MFRDTGLLLEGLIVNSFTALFFRDYYTSTSKFIDDIKYYQAKELNQTSLVQLIPSGPDYKIPPIRNTYVKLINNAKKSIKIMTPYLALDSEIKTSLIIAARGGVDVSIIVPGVPDKKIIYELTQAFFEDLMEEGVKIYKYNDHFTHAKILIMDDYIASCGTYNLDNRSARINFESTVLLYKTGVERLVKDFEDDLRCSKEVSLSLWKNRPIMKRLFEGLISLISPLA
jgi:cardiolipin synthase